MRKIIAKKLITKPSAKKANKKISTEKFEAFDNDLYAAMGKWIAGGRRVSACLGDFYVKTKNRTTFGNPFIALLLEKKIKIDVRYYTYYDSNGKVIKSSGKEIEYDRTIADSLAREYGLPAIYLRGYNQGLVNPHNCTKNFAEQAIAANTYLCYPRDVDMFHRGMKKGQQLHVTISHILHTNF